MLSLFRTSIQRSEAGVLKILPNATCTIYNTMPDGTAPVDSTGTVQAGATLAPLFNNRAGTIAKSNPVTSDAQGYIEGFKESSEVHVLVVLTDGTRYGLPWIPHVSPAASTSEETPSGIVGNGVANDTLAIQSTLDSLFSSGGGTVNLPVGIFSVDNLKVPTGVSIEGSGRFGTVIKGRDKNVDVITLVGNRINIRNLKVEGVGVGGAGTGRGINHLGVDGAGTPILVYSILIENCEIIATPSWGINIQGHPTTECFECYIVNTQVLSAISDGSLQWGFGSSAPTLICRGSKFDGPATGTYGVGGMDRGGVHLNNATNVSFEQCLFEPTNSPALSIFNGCNGVVVRDCKFTMFVGADSGKYFITTSGFNQEILIDGCPFTNLSTTTGPRILKTDNNASGGGNTGMKISNCVAFSPKIAAVTDDIFLGSGADYITVDNCYVIRSTDGVQRPIVVFNNVDTADRRHVHHNALSIPQPYFNHGHILLGIRHLWLDANLTMRTGLFGNSVPASATDGDLVAVDNAFFTFTNNDTTPDVSFARNFIANNGSATTITAFDGGRNGQVIHVLFRNANTTINETGNIKLIGTTVTPDADDMLSFIFDGASWYQMAPIASN